ncbi:Asp-tRNA(Asn)/Glu-tRNA(Gln) amidotransferase subunit GatA [Candidatus Saccharibacteria bacterium]|nr:Asp-tRNA(Asn)/Glu-tRNA(Gln) amidotransferase subunit GatA [Candidatus Saccharibacteria bacterium]MCB9834935.1 Asp-tRNA(Asn)/Glu-tRNA(Gln) amidotransferase subunit GatA [Candidatus Nomurabacteria bacterium]
MNHFTRLTIDQAHHLINSNQITVLELVEYYFDQIESSNNQLHIMLAENKDQAINHAKSWDQKISNGHKLTGLEAIPYLAKDMFMTKGIATTAASRSLADFIPPYSSTAISKLTKAGAILLGKVNQDEFAHGGSGKYSFFGSALNPNDPTRVAGGSSSGSAASVAADYCIFSLGTDTGGSIRNPASYTGTYGLKPSYGRISRYGVIAMASSFDCVGIIARSNQDIKIVLGFISGHDQLDSTSLPSKLNLNKSASIKRIALVKQYQERLKPDQTKAFSEITDQLEARGVKVETIDLPSLEQALACYYILVPAEISSNLARYDGLRYGYNSDQEDLIEVYKNSRKQGFGVEVQRRIMIGTYLLSHGYYDAFYLKANKLRQQIQTEIKTVFKQFDLILSPTTPDIAPLTNTTSIDPTEEYLADIMTVVANLAGIPAISLPKMEISGLPYGLQAMADQEAEHQLLELEDLLC